MKMDILKRLKLSKARLFTYIVLLVVIVISFTSLLVNLNPQCILSDEAAILEARNVCSNLNLDCNDMPEINSVPYPFMQKKLIFNELIIFYSCKNGNFTRLSIPTDTNIKTNELTNAQQVIDVIGILLNDLNIDYQSSDFIIKLSGDEFWKATHVTEHFEIFLDRQTGELRGIYTY